MATMGITIDVDETMSEALTKAAASAGESLSAYLILAANERMIRDSAGGYHAILAGHPELAADIAAARQAAIRSRAAVRAQVLAKYGAAAH